MRTTTLAAVLSVGLLLPRIGRAQQQSTIRMNLYSDVSATADTTDEPWAFKVGGVDFFTTSRVNEHINLVSENVLEILGEDGTVFDLERLFVDIGPSPAFMVRIGREHMPVGFYAQNFHHALLFQLATSRPLVLGFEDEGGVLPAHTIGAIVHGRLFEDSPVVIGYDVGISNGRGQFADDVLSVFDRNDAKSWSARLTAMPNAINGLQIGISGVYDVIPDGFVDHHGDVVVTEELRELIGCAHVVYRSYPVDLVAEGYVVRHTGLDTGTTWGMVGGFVQLGVEIGKVTPFGRVDHLSRDAADPWFDASHAPVEALQLHLGTRYALTANVVAKLEGVHDHVANEQSITGQLAFGF